MKITFPQRDKKPHNLLADVELEFETGDLAGLKYTGIALWRGKDGGIGCTFPSRKSGEGTEAKYWDYLRTIGRDAGPIKRLKAKIVEAWESEQGEAHIPDSEPRFFGGAAKNDDEEELF